MAISRIEVFETEDGQLFRTIEEARFHLRSSKFDAWYRSENEVFVHGVAVPPDIIKTWLTTNKAYIMTEFYR